MDKPETVRMNMKQKKEMKVGRKERKLRMREGTERIKYKKKGLECLGGGIMKARTVYLAAALEHFV